MKIIACRDETIEVPRLAAGGFALLRSGSPFGPAVKTSSYAWANRGLLEADVHLRLA